MAEPTQAEKNAAKDKKPRAPRNRTPKSTVKLKEGLTDLFIQGGALVYVFNQPDGNAIMQGSERLAGSLETLAKENPAIRKALEKMLKGSAWGGVVLASASIALPIAVNHGLIPQELAGIMSLATQEQEPGKPETAEQVFDIPPTGTPLAEIPAVEDLRYGTAEMDAAQQAEQLTT